MPGQSSPHVRRYVAPADEARLIVMRLDCAPPDLVRTREALHAIAEQVLAPARVRETGSEIALEATPGGFGTPAFPAGDRLLVQGAELVVEAADGGEHRAPITSLRAAARLAGLEADELPGDALDVGPRAAEFLGAFYTFADAQLRNLRADAEDPSPIHLWPEHFDLAFDAGDEADGRRATYGASPGDEKHPEPYLYVAPWRTPAPSVIWNAHGFTGAELAWAELAIDEDPRAAALDFWRAARAALAY
jgi:hypothetical protein